MARPDAGSELLADLEALLDHIGPRGVSLTDTGRLRMADVEAINDRFAAPASLSERFGEHTHRARREDEVRRVHFVRLAAQAAGLLDARIGRVRATAGAAAFMALGPEEAARRLFIGWWWKGAWDLISFVGAIDVALMRDRVVTARALSELGILTYRLDALGARILNAFGFLESDDFMDDRAWGAATWRVCLEPLAAFGGARPTYTTREVNGHRFKELAALALTERGLALLAAALAARPATPPRVRRGMASAYPVAQAGVRTDSDLLEEDERRERIWAEHPEYRRAIERGEERIGEVSPRAHLALHQAVAAQLAANDPRAVRQTYDRLLQLGHEDHAIRHAIGDALAREIWKAQHEQAMFDVQAYAARLAEMRGLSAGSEPDAPPAPLPPASLAADDRERLQRLPRSPDIWEGDLTDLAADIEGEPGPVICAIWTAGDGMVLASLPDVGAEPGQVALAAFVRAALRPDAGPARLPSRVRVHPELASALRDALSEIGVVLEEADDLPGAHDALDALAEFLVRPAKARPRRRRRR